MSDRQSTIKVESNEAPFGEQLRVLRERAALTQEELAERAGLSRDAISALERGRRSRPHPPTMAAIVEALGLSGSERDALRLASRRSSIEETAVPRLAIRRIPALSTRLIGRKQELDAIGGLITNPGIRLVTLNGPAGVGKTRLAIEIATQTVDQFPGGTAFIPFSAIWDSTLILPTVASAMGGRIPEAWKSNEQSLHYPALQPFLIILDNLEHLPGAPAIVAELVATIPDITILATSRSPLRLQDERSYPLHPFAVEQSFRVVEGVAEHEQDAVDLFMERARAVDPGFRESERTRQAVMAICRRLDGLPLAIELAAARVKVLPPEAMLDRLDQSLKLLSGGPRDQETRLQSIRAAIAWSYDLLEPLEQAAFRALAVFSGGFTMEAAETVLSEALDIDEFAALELVASLIDKSLVRSVVIDTPDPRFLMLFTIRSFGHAELEASAESDKVHEAHIRWITGVIERAANSFRNEGGDLQWTHYSILEAERGNWRSALSWLHEHRQSTRLVRLTTALSWFWYVRGPLQEGRDWLDRALLMDQRSSPPADRAAVLVGHGMLAYFAGDTATATLSLEESIAVGAADREPWWYGCALMLLGMAAVAQGDYQVAERHLTEAQVTFKAIPHPINESLALGYQAVAIWGGGDAVRSSAVMAKSIAMQRENRARWWLATALGYLSLMTGEQNDLLAAAVAENESLQIRWQETRMGSDDSGTDPGDLRWQAGVWDDAAAALADLAVLASRTGIYADAAMLFGAANASWRQVGRIRANLPERLTYEAAQETVRIHLGAETFVEHFARGQEILGENALNEALSISDAILAALTRN